MAIGRLTRAAACATVLAFEACSSSHDETTGVHSSSSGGAFDGVIFSNGGSTSSGSSATGGGSGANATSSPGTGGAPPVCVLPPGDAGCVGQAYQGEALPLDIYVMFDQSGSMSNIELGGITRMTAVRDALESFLGDRASEGLSVGIGYFGQQPIGKAVCDPAVYSQADVPIAALPGNAGAIADSLARREPTGETPTGSAIRGACSVVRDYKTAHPDRKVVLLVVTDGYPEAPVTCSDGATTCCPTLPDAVAATKDCNSGASPIQTFVLGVGPYLDNLTQIAVAGGTKTAYFASGPMVSKEVLDALNQIRAAAQIPCTLALPTPPDGQKLELDRVNLVKTTIRCESKTLVYQQSAATCDSVSGGWYFDNEATPTAIKLCKKTCDDLTQPGARLQYSIGCARVGQIR